MQDGKVNKVNTVSEKERASRVKASVKWAKSRDTITLRPSKEEGAEIRAAAEAAGVSLTEYVLDAVRSRIAHENVIE